jgi:hypothetical protein
MGIKPKIEWQCVSQLNRDHISEGLFNDSLLRRKLFDNCYICLPVKQRNELWADIHNILQEVSFILGIFRKYYDASSDVAKMHDETLYLRSIAVDLSAPPRFYIEPDDCDEKDK